MRGKARLTGTENLPPWLRGMAQHTIPGYARCLCRCAVGARRLSNGPFQFNFTADVGRYYQLLASTNLREWVVLTNLAAPASNVLFLDPAAPNYPYRFYQARPSP